MFAALLQTCKDTEYPSHTHGLPRRQKRQKRLRRQKRLKSALDAKRALVLDKSALDAYVICMAWHARAHTSPDCALHQCPSTRRHCSRPPRCPNVAGNLQHQVLRVPASQEPNAHLLHSTAPVRILQNIKSCTLFVREWNPPRHVQSLNPSKPCNARILHNPPAPSLPGG
jgi:hypothetical protein